MPAGAAHRYRLANALLRRDVVQQTLAAVLVCRNVEALFGELRAQVFTAAL